MENAVFYFFSFFVEAIVLWQYASNLFIAKHKTWASLIILCSLYLALFSISLFESQWLNTILYFLANFIFLVTQCRLKWYSAFFHSAILIAIMGMCELMAYGIISLFAPQFLHTRDSLHNLIIFAIFSKIMFFTVIYVLIQLLKGRQKCNQRPDKSAFLLVFIPITSVFIMLTFVNISETDTLSLSLYWMVVLSAILLLIANLLVFGINQYNQRKSIEFTEMQLLLQKESDLTEYYEMLLSQNENQSILIHDIKKHLQSIDMLNDEKDHEKISAYIRQLMHSSDLKEFSRLCDHEMLNAILSRYQRQCSDKQIDFHADIRSGNIDFITDTDLTSLFCNLLDNAIESADGIPDSFIEVNTVRREKTPFIVISVINSCRKNPFSDQNGRLTTTKQDRHKHGFGMKSIRKTVNKYNGDMQMYYNDDTSTFHTIISLKQ
jgi:signal transduction histidine kinase